MRLFIILFFVLSSLSVISQEKENQTNEEERTIPIDDPKYREDQFYVGVTHSILTSKPSGLRQRSISTGVTFGFLRDVPVNKKRNIAIAPGFGFSFYNLNHNLATLNSENYTTGIVQNYSTNRQNLWYFEVPLEFRYRTSTMISHKFWRGYFGIKYSYLLSDRSRYEGESGEIFASGNPDISRSNMGVYASGGFNTWNLYVYYGFQPLFKNTASGEGIKFFNVGLIFYIL